MGSVARRRQHTRGLAQHKPDHHRERHHSGGAIAQPAVDVNPGVCQREDRHDAECHPGVQRVNQALRRRLGAIGRADGREEPDQDPCDGGMHAR
jgi:hypothetical protein